MRKPWLELIVPVGRSYPGAAMIKRCAEAGRTYETTTTSETDAGHNAIFETKPRNHQCQRPLLTDVSSPVPRMDSTCSKQHMNVDARPIYSSHSKPVSIKCKSVNSRILLIFRSKIDSNIDKTGSPTKNEMAIIFFYGGQKAAVLISL